MYSLLLAVIYISFISLGLPDSLLGSSWPDMHLQMGVPVSYAGVVTMIISGGTIFSSLFSDRIIKRLGTGLVTAVSVFLTAAALFGFSFSSSFVALCLWAVPYGLGAGAVDAALNNYVALHYTSRHMNWLHCCWGVGAAVSPFIMGYSLQNGLGWNAGYRTVSILQIVLACALFLALPLWKGGKDEEHSQRPAPLPMGFAELLRIKGAKHVLLAFFGYCALEATTGLWATSFLVLGRGVDSIRAARYASYFFLGITVGRFISGLLSDRAGDRNMIRVGIAGIILGVAAVWLPVGPDWVCLAGLMIIGLGCAPIYPAIIHSTPVNFGEERSQSMIGIQMAGAYLGSTIIPPIFGAAASWLGVGLYPAFLMAFALFILFFTERLNRVVAAR